MRLSHHFSLAEFERNSRGIENKAPARAIDNLTTLCKFLLEPLRELVGKPIQITSGYRSPSLNALVGGTPTSQHSTGQACDINVSGMQKTDLFKLVVANLDFDQCIMEYDSNCLHLSYTGAEKNRHEIYIRRKISGKKKYFPQTKNIVAML